MLSRQAREAIVVRGLDYLRAKAKADEAEAERSAQGKAIIEALAEVRKRKVVGVSAKDNSRVVVGYGTRSTTIYDAPSLMDVLREVGLLERVTKVVVDEKALAEVLQDEAIGVETIKTILGHLTVRKTKYPIVRSSKL